MFTNLYVFVKSENVKDIFKSNNIKRLNTFLYIPVHRCSYILIHWSVSMWVPACVCGVNVRMSSWCLTLIGRAENTHTHAYSICFVSMKTLNIFITFCAKIVLDSRRIYEENLHNAKCWLLFNFGRSFYSLLPIINIWKKLRQNTTVKSMVNSRSL